MSDLTPAAWNTMWLKRQELKRQDMPIHWIRWEVEVRVEMLEASLELAWEHPEERRAA